MALGHRVLCVRLMCEEPRPPLSRGHRNRQVQCRSVGIDRGSRNAARAEKPVRRAVSRRKAAGVSNQRRRGRIRRVSSPKLASAAARSAEGLRPDVKSARARAGAGRAGRGAEQLDHAARDRGRRVDPAHRPRRKALEPVEQQRDSACRRARSCRCARAVRSTKQGAISARIASSATGSPRSAASASAASRAGADQRQIAAAGRNRGSARGCIRA